MIPNPLPEFQILQVEDELPHLKLFERNIRRGSLNAPIYSVTNGKEALAYLENYLADPTGLPLLVVMDLNMPVMNGIETLRRFQADERLKALPVIVLTTSDEPHEMLACEAMGYRDYLIKPVTPDKMESTIRRVMKIGA